ncbi:putative quinol monooxygenase [Bradyrhizobium sp. CCGUVB14]|uniref:putative quinol monooxygenase n=1 Tax=Bradyrhizobium sp. CCGUVB14 TaxID=2949628 RepID=UPI0020B2BD99|nr:putative quinol monooxygenase [Bradyrhizobium sp. CCGUVB14]MCP3446052.1 antibiotic biosynthesis monooxygenase [Bradyrhizobium sp. CCGUVB14]
MTIVVSVKYVLKPGKRDELLSFVMANVENTRKENGNLAYSHYPSLENPDEMFVFEKWETLKDLENHINMPHYVAFDDRRKPLLESYEAEVYEATLCSTTNRAPRAS